MRRFGRSRLVASWLIVSSIGAVLQNSSILGEETRPVRQDLPNIILCMADDQGWQDVGFNGHPILKTPNLDRMANQGLQFNRWYAAAPVCSPTRGSCLTGRHPFRYGIYTANKGHIKPKEILLSEILKQSGYATGHFGKWHLGTMTTKIKDANRGKPGNTKDYAPPWENGFDVCFSTESKVPTFDPMKNPGSESKATRKGVPRGGEYGTFYWTGPDQRVPDDQLSGDDSMLIVNQAIQFIAAAKNEEKPFFVVIWFHAPHLPVVADPEHRALYPDHPFGLYGQHYAGCISALDDAIGKLVGELASMDIASNTMLWYSSDNGPEGKSGIAPGSAGDFRGRKRDLYEGGVRTPGFLVWPEKINSPRTTDVPCVTSDYFPTILDHLDIDLPDRPYDGISLMPLIEDRMKLRNRPIGFQSKDTSTWNTDQYKLIVKGKDLATQRVELFDLLADPAEAKDLSAEQPELVLQMKRALENWQASCEHSDSGGDY